MTSDSWLTELLAFIEQTEPQEALLGLRILEQYILDLQEDHPGIGEESLVEIRREIRRLEADLEGGA